MEAPSNDMARSIRNLGFPVERLRTGTPPRLDVNTIDFSGLDAEVSDDPVQLFSFLHEYQGFRPPNELIKCYTTRTNKMVHDLVMEHQDSLPQLLDSSG